ncbi:sulfatase family protein [Desertihabitans aurantiacus]|uniref:sulfatase family protein n=1 Tax=Desertihabitans aurantiacus TaxID=2282477 RepID=UPI000DF7EF8F|nr:sulfatase [Desertihabitans aurantiacus]
MSTDPQPTSSPRGGAAARPDIVYLHSHDTGRELSPYGAPVATPNLQALAERGTVFRRAFAAAPTCSPSRAALLTGQWPHQTGMLGLAHRGHRLHRPRRHLAAVLGAAGYATALAGLQHLTPDPEEVRAMGYQQVIGTAENAETAATAFIESRPSEPFFLDVGFFETHRHAHNVAFNADDVRGDHRYAPAPPGLPDTPPTRADYADYAVSAARLDAKIGQVVEAIERTGRLERTLVVVTTDHGIPFPRAKCNANDRGLGVSLVLAGLPQVAGGRVVDGLVSHIDLYPTVCELAGVVRPSWVEGRSLLPLLDGSVSTLNEEVFGEVTFHVAYEPVRSVRTDRFRYTRRFGDQHRPELRNCDDSLSKDRLVEARWADVPVAKEELFDLVLDPTESRNLIAEPALAATADDLRRRLEEWMVRTADPVLDGKPFEPPYTKTSTAPGAPAGHDDGRPSGRRGEGDR